MKVHLLSNGLSGLAILAFLISGCGSSSSSGTSSAAKQEWVWVGGTNYSNQPGVYGTQGQPSPQNTPGARMGAASWTDTQGNFWLFGGLGIDSKATPGNLNDLWEFSNGEWTWVSGSSTTGGQLSHIGGIGGDAGQSGVYGTLGVASPGNTPGARGGSSTWVDAQGNLWLFGGFGVDANGSEANLNDLWKLSNREWTWMGGENVISNTPRGIYGTIQQSASANIPGPRSSASAWIDSSGNFWLFGGVGVDATGKGGSLNDLWKYSSGQWTWMAGSNLVNGTTVAGQRGASSSGNTPGARSSSATWTDTKGNLWLFGGQGTSGSEYNDLWEFSNGQWTWMGGSTQANQLGTYGTKGTPAPTNIPSGRDGAAAWTDAQGNFWLFGGQGTIPSITASGATTTIGEYNDLWEYSSGQWTWEAGTNIPDDPGSFGTINLSSTSNTPPSRSQSVSWIDKNGNLWLFGGSSVGLSSNTSSGSVYSIANDLWEYTP